MSNAKRELVGAVLLKFRRKTFRVELEDLIVQVLSLAQAMKLVKLGHISLDGATIKANASKHKALSHGHIEKLEAQLREEVQALLQKAAEVDWTDAQDGIDLPGERARRQDRLKALAEAKAKIEKLPDVLGQPQALLADRGYFSADNVKACCEPRIDPLIAPGRDRHHVPLAERLAPDATEPETDGPVGGCSIATTIKPCITSKLRATGNAMRNLLLTLIVTIARWPSVQPVRKISETGGLPRKKPL